MKTAIVDDDGKARECLRSYITELVGNLSEIDEFESGEQFLASFSQGVYDLVILDIFMNKITGMDVAREIRKTDKNIRIVFATSSNEYASESYEVDAKYYLHKPIDRSRVKAMLDRLNIDEIELMRTTALPGGKSVILRSIIYADFSSHCVTLHCKRGENIALRMSFSEIEPVLCAYPYFYSPCKGTVINFYEVTSQINDTFTLSDGSIIPISRRKAKDVLDAYSSFRFELLRKGGEL